VDTLRSERGSTLILLIGIVAALAMLAATLVVLTQNVTANNYNDQTRVKAFNVAEGALDTGMYGLSRYWPIASPSPSASPLFDSAAFAAKFLASNGFPGVAGSATAVDDPNPAGIPYLAGYSAANPPPWDANGNKQMLVTATGTVGKSTAKVQAIVRLTYFNMQLPRGMALFATGNLISNGGGNNPKITVEVAPPTGTTTSIHVGGSIDDTSVAATGIAQFVGSAAGSINDVFPLSMVQALKATAQASGRYFTSQAAAEASPADPVWSPQGGITGLTVIEPTTPTEVRFQGNATYNSESSPGLLMVLGGSALTMGGNMDFYGVVYSQGDMSTAHGTPTIHGMAISTGNENLIGTANLEYNDSCVAKLLNLYPLNVKLVPNTWRELKAY
jgi:hypothetical protein